MGGEARHNRLSSADLAGLAALTCLESFEIWGGCDDLVVDPLPEAFFEIPNLRSLALGRMWFPNLARRLGRLTGLSSLSVSRWHGGAEANLIAHQVSNLRNLATLDLSYNFDLDRLPDLSALTALRTLCWEYTGFRWLPVEQLRKLPVVQQIDFSDCSNMVIPWNLADLAGLRHLRELSITDCKPSHIGMQAIGSFVVRLYDQEPELRVSINGEKPGKPDFGDTGPRQGNCLLCVYV